MAIDRDNTSVAHTWHFYFILSELIRHEKEIIEKPTAQDVYLKQSASQKRVWWIVRLKPLYIICYNISIIFLIKFTNYDDSLVKKWFTINHLSFSIQFCQ